MASPVKNLRTFLIRLENLKGKRRIFAFILFDERPSSQPIDNYLKENFNWVDSLAKASKMIIFFHSDKNSPKSHNPSLAVASMFGINAKQLPGIVFFTLPEFNVGNGIFFPLDEKLFADDARHVEEILSQLFSIVQECQQESNTEEMLFQKVKSKIDTLILREKMRPIGKYMGKNLQAISNIPTSFFEKLGEHLGLAAIGLFFGGRGTWH